MSSPFPLRLGVMFSLGMAGFRRQPLPLLAAGAVTLAVLGAFGVLAQNAFNDDRVVVGLVYSLVGSVLGGAVAYPWFHYALQISRGGVMDIFEPLREIAGFKDLFVCSFWFWAAFLLGLQYLSGIPSLLVLVLYAFYGYVVADGRAIGGLRALGTSVRLGQGRRIALFGILVLYAIFNFCALIPFSFGVNVVTVPSAALLFLITSSITMVGGAVLYDALVPTIGWDSQVTKR